MLQLGKPVIVNMLVSRTMESKVGKIVGRTYAEVPRYDVMVEGQIVADVPADQVREIEPRNSVFALRGK